MEAIKHIVRTPQNHEVRIKIPQHVPENDLVEIILFLSKKPNDYERKIKELKTTKPLDEKEYSLEQLLDGVTEQNLHTEIDTGNAIGKEVW